MKYRKESIVSIILLIITAGLLYLLYIINYYNTESKDVQSMGYYLTKINDNIARVSYEGDDLVSLIRTNKDMLNDPELEKDISISSVDQMYKLCNLIEPETFGSKWVKSYIHYTTWCYIESCLDEDAEDYWHMKYIASNNVGKYNYATLIKYKRSGFIITNLHAFSFWILILIFFVGSYNVIRIIFNMRNIIHEGKRDDQG